MRKNYFPVLIVLFLFLGLYSCKERKKENIFKCCDQLELKYATGFTVHYHNGYKEVTVYDPWGKNEILSRYYLVGDLRTQTPDDKNKIYIPLNSIALNSVTHLEFLNLLGELEKIKGICSSFLVYNSDVLSDLEKGEIIDLGSAFNPDVEKVFSLNPSVVMASAYKQEDINLLRINKGGIPILYNNGWLETTLLGRAEWIKFVASFFNKEEMADSVFNLIEENYNEIKDIAQQAKKKKTILSGSNFRGTWYMPSGSSYMGNLFKDAYCDYFYSNDSSTGSLPLNFETVLMNFSEAEVWINCNFNSIKELIEADERHALFASVKSKNVYNFNKRLLPSGANDFWESGIARPNLILQDLIAILHPELLPKHNFNYASKLK